MSRLSEAQPLNGPYTFVMEARQWVLYYQSKNVQKHFLFYKFDAFVDCKGSLAFLGFYSAPEYGAFELGLKFNLSNSCSFERIIFSRPKFNSTYSMLRVDIDGNVRTYTYAETMGEQASVSCRSGVDY